MLFIAIANAFPAEENVADTITLLDDINSEIQPDPVVAISSDSDVTRDKRQYGGYGGYGEFLI